MLIIIKNHFKIHIKLAIALLLISNVINIHAKTTNSQTSSAQSLPADALKLDKRWVHIGDSNAFLFKPGEPGTIFYFLDKATVRQTNGIMIFWICEVYSENSNFYVSGVHKRISKWEYDTNTDTVRMGSISTFGEAEDALSSNNKVSEWMAVRPGSVLEGIVNSAREYLKK